MRNGAWRDSVPVSGIVCAAVLVLLWYPLRLPAGSTLLSKVWSLVHDVTVGFVVLTSLPVGLSVLRRRAPWFRDIPLLYLALCAVSVVPLLTVPTLGPPYVRMQLVTLATSAAIYLCVYARARAHPRLIACLALAWGSWALSSAVRAILGAAMHGRLRHDFVDAMGHTNSRAGFEMVVMLLIGGIALKGSRRHRLAALPFLLLLLVSLGLSLSRGAWLGLLAGAVCGAWLQWGWKRAIGVAVVTVVVVALLPGPIGLRARSAVDAGFATNMFRVSAWRAAFDLIAQSPWGGTGYDTVWFAILTHLDADTPALAGRHVHNILLQTWVETGVLGMAALIATGVGLLRCAAHLRRVETPGMRAAALGATLMLVGMIAHGMVDCTWRDYGTQVMFWSLAGWLVAMRERMVAPT